MVMQCRRRARNSCIEKAAFSSTLLPVFCLSLLQSQLPLCILQ